MVAAAVYINLDLFAVVGPGEAQLLVPGLEELDIAQTEGFTVLAQLAQPLEVGEQLPVFPAPGVGPPVEGIFITLYACLVTVVQAGVPGSIYWRKEAISSRSWAVRY